MKLLIQWITLRPPRLNCKEISEGWDYSVIEVLPRIQSNIWFYMLYHICNSLTHYPRERINNKVLKTLGFEVRHHGNLQVP